MDDKKNRILLAIVGFNFFLIATVAVMYMVFPDRVWIQYGAGIVAGVVGGAIGWVLGPMLG